MLRNVVAQLVVLVNPEHAVRRKALDSKRPGYADLPSIDVRPVVEVLGLSPGGNRRVDLLLTRDAGLPPFAMRGLGSFRPADVRLAWDLPLLPILL